MKTWGACVLMLALGATTARAQLGLPAGGQSLQDEILRRQRQLDRQTPAPEPEGPVLTVPEQAHPRDIRPGGPAIVLKQVKRNESALLDAEAIDAVIARHIGQSLDLAGLNQIIIAINQLYADRGFVTANAIIPPQKLRDGVLTIQLVESRIGAIDLPGATTLSRDFVLDRLGQREGQVLRLPDLSRDIQRFNRLSEANLRAALEPGETTATTAVHLQVTEPPRDALSLFIDSKGSPTTGATEAGAYYRRYGLLGVDDRFTAYTTRSAGNEALNLGYTVPLGADLPKLSITYGRSDYRVVAGPTRSLMVDGKSETTGVSLAVPLYVAEGWLIQAVEGIASTTTASRVAKNAITDLRAWRINNGAVIGYQEDGLSLSLSPNIALVRGLDHLRSRTRDFELATGTASGFVALPWGASLQLNGAWQFGNRAHLSSDQQFELGGPTTLRGYATNTAAGDGGAYLNTELHRRFGIEDTSLDAYVFTDAGKVTGPVSKNARNWLVSGGIGASWQPIAEITLDVLAGLPMTRITQGQAGYQLYGGVTFRPF